MADRPIMFSAPMVRALLDGRKSQTRRVLKPQPVQHVPDLGFTWGNFTGLWPDDWFGYGGEIDGLLPYASGDRLWVREASIIAPPGWTDSPVNPMGPHRQEVAYLADDSGNYTRDAAKDYGLRRRPSIHMPRWASRLTLIVTDVRVQRLQDISEVDILAEGAPLDPDHRDHTRDKSQPFMCLTDSPWHTQTPRAWFHRLWNSLHGDDAWDANPWVVAVSFDVQRGNIDRIGG